MSVGGKPDKYSQTLDARENCNSEEARSASTPAHVISKQPDVSGRVFIKFTTSINDSEKLH